ncbi:MAG: hypothetical protein AB8B95_11530 [Pseudohongiellaceae bacterium]
MNTSTMIKICNGSLLLVLVSGCISQSEQDKRLITEAPGHELSRCFDLADEFRQAVDSQRVTNASAPALANAPILHHSRFLNHLAASAVTDSQIEQWVSLTSTLGNEIRNTENPNLREPWSEQRLTELTQCAAKLTNDTELKTVRRDLVGTSRVFQDHYRPLPQWLGFNWLLRPIFQWRIRQLHQQEQLLFDTKLQFDDTVSYSFEESLEPTPNFGTWFAEAYEDSPLNLPVFSKAQLDSLFQLHAPSFTVELEDDNDRIGKPYVINKKIEIDTSNPEIYVLPSYTEFGGANLLQLNYVVWFSERKPLGLLDLYSGKIDSLIWRVTLDQQGNVLLYDSIHSCGCYHKYFMASDTIKNRSTPLSKEPANVFDLTHSMHQRKSNRPQLWLTANEHYVVDIDFESPLESQAYTMQDYQQLSQLKNDGTSRSFFSATGIIEQSKRLERFTLWPTGIESVGAMRQWGTHATGFVQQQQFDDPTLLDNYFTREK